MFSLKNNIFVLYCAVGTVFFATVAGFVVYVYTGWFGMKREIAMLKDSLAHQKKETMRLYDLQESDRLVIDYQNDKVDKMAIHYNDAGSLHKLDKQIQFIMTDTKGPGFPGQNLPCEDKVKTLDSLYKNAYQMRLGN